MSRTSARCRFGAPGPKWCWARRRLATRFKSPAVDLPRRSELIEPGFSRKKPGLRLNDAITNSVSLCRRLIRNCPRRSVQLSLQLFNLFQQAHEFSAKIRQAVFNSGRDFGKLNSLE